MKAVLLVGGQGTRMRPLTYDVPKPLLPVAGVPYLEQLIYYLKRFGITEIILTACYLSDQIKVFCAREQEFGMSLKYVIETSPLGTGGAVANVRNLLDGPFFVFNGDILTDFNLSELRSFHQERKGKISLALVEVEDPSRFGVADLRSNGAIARFVEKPKKEEAPSRYINAGVYLIDPSVLSLVPEGAACSIERELFPKVAARGGLFGKVFTGYWLDMGTPEDYLKAHRDFLDHKINLKNGGAAAGSALVGKNSTIEAGASVGPHVVIGRDCVIERGATVLRSVLWNRVKIGSGCRVVDSILGDDVSVDHQSHLQEEVIQSGRAIGVKGADTKRSER